MIPAATPGNNKIVWILESSGKLSAYDTTNFHLRMESTPLPSDVRDHPERILAISPAGLVMYRRIDGHTRIWNLRLGGEPSLPWDLSGVDEIASPPAQPGAEGTASGASMVKHYEAPQLAFSADGQRLFWFQNRMHVLQQRDLGDVSRTGSFLCWSTDIKGRDIRTLAHITFPECKCDTGACEETCPEIRSWTPAGGVTSFFYLTRFIPGQLSETDLETDLYQRAGAGWKGRKLRSPVEEILDARDGGDMYIAAIPDVGCCGWVNESDDMTSLIHDGERTTLFDEFARFHNQDYDVSFSTANAKFSPDGTEIAYTITASSKAGQPIRLASQGKKNPQELRRIEAALLTLPLVEDVAVAKLQKPRFSFANTALIGWVSVHQLLVWRAGEVFLVDTTSGRFMPTGLRAERAADVFLQ